MKRYRDVHLSTDDTLNDMLDMDDEFDFDEGVEEDVLPDEEEDIITAEETEEIDEDEDLAVSVAEDNE